MTRAAYIGGFGNGETSAEGVKAALVASGQYEDADYFTFAQAMDSPEDIKKTVQGVDVYTHSAGIMALKGTVPKEIVGVAAPLPSSIPGLVAKTGVKSAKMLGHSLTGTEAFVAVNKYNVSALKELASHPVGNLKHLREIAKANAIKTAGAAQDAGILTRLYFMDRDDYGFQPNEEQQLFAKVLGVELRTIEGRHDQLPLYPAQTLEQINAGR